MNTSSVPVQCIGCAFSITQVKPIFILVQIQTNSSLQKKSPAPTCPYLYLDLGLSFSIIDFPRSKKKAIRCSPRSSFELVNKHQGLEIYSNTFY
ncbi:hypothetical protein L6452_18120 [Arctium lappa]|uniref:Uncharacterized protein n=1 Tax=Arctium lappa TaxID=4217 RepID=A0ACB9C5F9_ARCLA|nr:hypothetical protein L6452_18120 [Arctium lappa]